MRVALLASPVLPVPAPAGGAQALVADLAAGLAGRGHEVIVYCSEGSHVPGVKLRTVPVPAGAERALVMPGGGQPQRLSGVHDAFARMFAMLRRDGADAVSSHAFDAEAFEMARGLPVLHTLHLPPIVDDVTRAAATVDTGGLATVSQSCRRDWARAGIDVGRVLFNGVPDFGEPASLVEPIALMAGRISPEKGIDDGVWSALQAGLKPVVVGPTYDRAYRLSLSGADFREALSREQLRELMARSAVILVPIRWDEPFGLVAAEAQMAGCPVAAYRRGAMPEVVEEGVSGYLAAPDSVEALAEAIRKALSLDRRAVRTSALRRLGLEPMLDGYESALKAIAG
jgi:glycosyltransferase involved in cell wall biosynthesis